VVLIGVVLIGVDLIGVDTRAHPAGWPPC